MADWILVPSLVRLRAEFNVIAPARDRSSDGSIGDQAHADRVSSHNPDETGAVPVRDADSRNEVHAIDVDVDLRTPGLTMEMVVQHLVARSRAGLEDRLRNIIYNRRIWAASSGWKQQTYTGDNPHDKHAHFEASYATAAEADTHSWHLEDIPVALTADDKEWIAAEVRKVFTEDGDTTVRRYSRDGLLTTVEQDTKQIRARLAAIEAKLLNTPPSA